MRLKATILGCGSSGGVPRLGGPDGAGDWGDCDPDDPRNRRRRCSILVQRLPDAPDGTAPGELTTVLIDTSPDLREQLLAASIARLDGVVITHEHADQCHGIDDLRALVLRQGRRLPVWFSEVTCPWLAERFAYCFTDNEKTGYPAILDHRGLPPGEWMQVDGPTGPIPIRPILVGHGPVVSYAFRCGGEGGEGGILYSPDVDRIPDEAWPMVMGPTCWIVDALRYRPHVSHSHVARSLEWLERSRAARGVLTNLHVDLDYRTLAEELPEGVVPAHDGLTVTATG